MEFSFGGGCASPSYYVVPFLLLGFWVWWLSCVLVRAVGMELEGDSLSGIREKNVCWRAELK